MTYTKPQWLCLDIQTTFLAVIVLFVAIPLAPMTPNKRQTRKRIYSVFLFLLLHLSIIPVHTQRPFICNPEIIVLILCSSLVLSLLFYNMLLPLFCGTQYKTQSFPPARAMLQQWTTSITYHIIDQITSLWGISGKVKLRRETHPDVIPSSHGLEASVE